MAAAELVHAADGRAHQGDGLGVASCSVGELGLGDRQHVVAHEGRDGTATVGEDAHRFDHSLRGGGAAGGGQRHHPVRQSEGGEAITDPRLRLVSQFLPAVADVDAEALEAKKHRRRVLYVDVGIRRGDRERSGEVAEARIVELEHRGMVAVLQHEQGAVPPEMVLQVVGAFPVGREGGEPLDAFAATALHLHHMGDGVRGPEIARVELNGAAPGWLGGEIIPGLLLRKTAAGKY